MVFRFKSPKIELALTGAKEQIAISAKVALLQTENATLGRVIDRNTIEELPLVNRNFTEILGLTAGINTDIVDTTQLGAGSQEIRANGARSGDNNFMLNGVDANSYSSYITEVTAFGGAGIAIPAPDHSGVQGPDFALRRAVWARRRRQRKSRNKVGHCGSSRQCLLFRPQ
jgi:hypothetical protein